jgi:hypothetical protein
MVATLPSRPQEFNSGGVGIAVAVTNSEIFVCSPDSSSIWKFTPNFTNSIWSVVAGLPGFPRSAPESADGTNSMARFYVPSGIAADTWGDLYVADSGNHTIRMGIPLETVPAAPMIVNISQTNDIAFLSWTALPGVWYEVQSNANLSSHLWTTLGPSPFPPILATNAIASFTDQVQRISALFYRVVLLP